MDTTVAIRTATPKDRQVYIQAEVGMVADSNPVSEWGETNKKALVIGMWRACCLSS